ncbi:DUF6221 family protein [Arthrobacter sp. AL12]|uniref:DUF6221 family protein n=1 Tax=Arthrobacter sp. AL12 TaxID=3042241 RepID=UPI00249C9A43|nr:DUF6221 family protein [Arthrobacter sp. AL12]MDI3210888.1 DUF6221 family protein [Arthrobacter sp. AL12]
MTGPTGAEWTGLVEFLEARIAEQEAAVREGTFAGTADVPESDDQVSLGQLMLDECAQKRAIIASWTEAADAEGIADLSQAEGTIAIARRSMLTILAGSHREHPDYDRAWSPALPTGMPGGAAKA